MTNLLDLPLDQFRGYLAEGNYPQARQDDLMRAYRAQNSLAGYLDRYGEDAYKGRLGLLDDGNMKVSSYLPVAVPKGMSIWDGLKSGRFQTRFKDYASDALGGVLGALENPKASYDGTLPQADYDGAAMASASLPMVAGGVVAGRLPDGAVAANNISELRRLANIQRFGYDPEEQPAPTSGGFDAYLSTVNPSGKRIQSENRPNLRMGDMYGMLPKSAQKVSSVDDVDIMRDGDDFYAVAYNPDVGEMDVVGYAQRGEGETDLMVVQEMQGKGVGGELQYQYRSANPTAPTGGLTEAGEGLLRNTYSRLRDDGTVNANASKSAGLLAANASSRPNLPVDGTLALPEKLQQTVTLNGKPVADWQPSDWGQFGQQYGVPNLGPTDGDAWRKSLVPYVTTGGRTITVPGGDQPFTYYDLLHLKSQAINPNDIPPDLHKSIHNRMVAAMDGGELTDERVANQMIFGMISPNQPLTANELALQRAMVKGPEDMKTLAGIAGYNYKQGVPDIKSRQETSRGITSQLGLQAEGRGGIGASGSANYTDISEMMQKLQDRPDFYRFDSNDNTMGGMSEAEKWGTFVTRVLNETRGLKAKTGSLATVWQQPGKAAISAIDRHMATLFRKDMFPSDKERRSWETALVKKFNKDQPKGEKVKSIDALLKAKGGRGVFVDNALAYVNKLPSAKTRSAKTGEFNERIPEAVRNTNWISGEPSEMQVIQGPYVRALEANQARANADGQSLFSSQWMLWDRIRKRLEPHEILYPGLEQLPRMSMPQMREVNKRHSEAGYKAAEGTVQPVANPSQLGYFANASAPVGLLAAQPSTEDELMTVSGAQPAWLLRALDPSTSATEGNETVRTTSSDVDGTEILYPTIRLIDGVLTRLSPQEAFQKAMEMQDFIVTQGVEDATRLSKRISSLIDISRNKEGLLQ